MIEYAHHSGVEKESKFPGHGYGVSITGGYVYRGKAIPALRGAYVYGDFVTGLIFAVRQKDGKADRARHHPPAEGQSLPDRQFW